MQPFPIFEEIARVMGVEFIPPFLGLVVEAFLVEFGDWRCALRSVLAFRVVIVRRIRDNVIPGVEFKNVVCVLEVAGAEFERVCPLQVVVWIMRTVR